MKQAAKLLQEADELAAKQDKNLTDMHNIVSPLLEAMENLGWKHQFIKLLKISTNNLISSVLSSKGGT